MTTRTTWTGIGIGIFSLALGACGGAAESRSAAAAYPGSPAMAYGGASPGGGAASSDVATAAPGSPPMPEAAPAPAAKSEAPKSADVPRAAPPPARMLPQPGQLTAGVWDDNKNFDFFKPYAAEFVRTKGDDFAMFGGAELVAARDAALRSQGPHPAIDVELVLDTTGSMGDELSYLQGEFDAIASKLRTRFPNVTPRWSLVLYRDKGDEYVTRTFDFTTDTAKFRRDLRAQAAAGGGDIPEAVVDGLDAGVRMSWRQQETSVAKMAFWVADAPAHPGDGPRLAKVLRAAQKKGIHLYPIAASDTDPAAEYQMRAAAQLTGGRYLFLTNDSGVGNDHAEPHIPCYAVTRLDNAIVRMIEVELTGRHVEPEGNEILRTVGKPNAEGKCTLPSGMLVASY